LEDGSPTSNEFQEALEEAANDSRSGLEKLAEALEATADALGEQNGESAEQAMREAAESLDEISDMVNSQQLQNQAAQQMEALREALRQQESQQGQQGEGNNDAASGEQGQQEDPSAQTTSDAIASTPQEGQGNTPQEGFQPGSADGSSEFTAGQPPEGISSDQTAPPISGNLQNVEPTGSGDSPTGLGFSPAQKTGDATSLEVQLQMQTTLALADEEISESDQRLEEEATREELSILDYRNVPSELTTAQQELLDQERIPREYQNVIKEYFQVIRPQQ